jgi:hypothetical protein
MMGKKKSGSPATFESEHGATRKLNATQKLAEIMCERVAAKEGRGLDTRFWLEPEWAKRFDYQMSMARSLLKLYDVEVILRALRANPRVYSLRAPFFLVELEKEQKKLGEERTRALNAPIIEISSTTEAPRIGVRPGRSARARLNASEAKGRQESQGPGNVDKSQ